MRSLLLLGALIMAAACGEEQAPDGICSEDFECSSGYLCLKSTSTCTSVVNSVPDLEVWPPNVNNQGWVAQEYQTPTLSIDGRLRLKLSPSISLEGKVYASDSKGKVIPARITAWRDSLLPGRPKVQVSTSTEQKQGLKRAPGSYLLWLTKGQSYTFLVSPSEPYDKDYPPLVVSGLKLTDHSKRDFVLEGKDRTIKVVGKVLDATGKDLPDKKLVNPALPVNPKDPTANMFRATVRVRAYQSGGYNLSTLGSTDPVSGAFSFRVPAGGTMPTGGLLYSLRVESISGGIPVPTVTCEDLVLGIYAGKFPEQTLGDLRMPAFRLPKYYDIKVRGKDGTKDGAPVAGAIVKFSMKFPQVPPVEGFASCKAAYERTGITNSDGMVKLPLLPGSDTKNQKYAVTITSPTASPYASAYMAALEVGPSGGLLATLVLSPRYKLTGKVVSKMNVAVAGALVEAQGIAAQGANALLPTAQTSTTTDKLGMFSLAVEAGSYNFQVTPPQGQGLPNYTIPNKSISGDLAGVQFTLPGARVLAGEVVDPTGRGLSSAKVEVYELIYDTNKTKRAALRASDLTGKDGFFSLLLPASN